MQALFILNAAAYGNESTYNGLRLGAALAKRQYNTVRVYLMGEAVGVARQGQNPPSGHDNLQTLLHQLTQSGADRVGVCGGCMDARGIVAEDLVEGAHRGTLEELADWSEWADKVFTF